MQPRKRRGASSNWSASSTETEQDWGATVATTDWMELPVRNLAPNDFVRSRPSLKARVSKWLRGRLAALGGVLRVGKSK